MCIYKKNILVHRMFYKDLLFGNKLYIFMYMCLYVLYIFGKNKIKIYFLYNFIIYKKKLI